MFLQELIRDFFFMSKSREDLIIDLEEFVDNLKREFYVLYEVPFEEDVYSNYDFSHNIKDIIQAIEILKNEK